MPNQGRLTVPAVVMVAVVMKVMMIHARKVGLEYPVTVVIEMGGIR